MGRAQLKHCLLDVDFFNNPKIRTLKSKFGQLAQLCLIDLYTAMSQATNAVIDQDCIEAILSEYKLKNDFLNYCLDKKLIQTELDGYSNSRVISDQQSLFKQQDKWRKAKQKSNDSSTPSPEIPTRKQQEGARKSEHLNTEVLNIDNKNSAPVESGLIKLSEHVRISPISLPSFEERMKSEQLDDKAKQEIIELLDRDFHKNPEKRRETCHYRDLISWPLREIRKDRAQLARKDPFKPPEKTIRQIREEAELQQKIRNLGT